MGYDLKDPDYGNPQGYYESYWAYGLNRRVVSGAISNEQWKELIGVDHKQENMWGFKDPWFLYLPDSILYSMEPTTKVICARRNKEDTVASWLRTVPDPEPKEKYERLVHVRNDLMEIRLKDFNRMDIHFDTQMDEDEIVARIGEWLCIT